MEELDDVATQLLLEIRDELVALNNKIDAQKRELENVEKRTVANRRVALIERMLARYDTTSVEFLDHVPYLVKRVYRIHRAGEPKRTPPQAAARSRPASRRHSRHRA